ncbi:S-adenosyl-L-methionine-dependent methyltransferase, partial [Clavulina sp. PMI_390]
PFLVPIANSSASVRVLDREFSNTGMIVIGEDLSKPLRYMRCDHSILGGRWLYIPKPDQTPLLGETIYSVFSLQEAGILAKRAPSTVTPRTIDSFFSGLGVGVSVNFFIQHGFHTTVVEIDPVVYKFARQYFGMHEPRSVHIEDARAWVHSRILNQATQLPEFQYDYIIHDCFSGGGVPEHIFTVEFWKELKLLLKDDGVLTVNFVGRWNSPAAHAVTATLLSLFTSCRAFHDSSYPVDVWEETPFLNIVFFCTDQSTLDFRTVTSDDYLDSGSSQHMLATLPEREVPLSRLLGASNSSDDALGRFNPTEQRDWIITDKHNQLNKWQGELSSEHFAIMQDILPQEVWNAY